jgi:hypothetical protein
LISSHLKVTSTSGDPGKALTVPPVIADPDAQEHSLFRSMASLHPPKDVGARHGAISNPIRLHQFG